MNTLLKHMEETGDGTTIYGHRSANHREKMKILYITTAFPRYKEDVIAPWLVETIKRLKEKGVEVEVFTSAYKGLKKQTIYGINVERFRYFLKKWEDLTHDEATPDRLRKGIRYKLLVPFYLLGGIIGITKLCTRKSYDIIHVHWPFPNAIFGYIGKRLCSARMVSSFHGVELRWVKNKMPFFIPLLKWAINKSDAVTANSTYTAKEINEITDRKVAIIPFGAAITESHHVMRDFDLVTQSRPSNILFVGRLVERKGVKYLIEAFDRISADIDAILTIVGDGPERRSLEKLVESKGLQNKVIFKGKVSNEELRRCYQNCDVFVLPACIDSRGDTEGLGVVLLEAMSYKKPVIASNVGGIVDIVKDGETGLLVPEKNSQKLAEAIHTVLKNDELASRLGKQGYEFVSRNFNWARITDQLIEIYSQLAKQ